MSDSGDSLPTRPRDGSELLYDYFKHMTSLSLITLGGVLTLSQTRSLELKPFSLGMVVIFLTAGGVSGFIGMDEIVKARFEGEDPPGRVRRYRAFCQAAFGIGVGGFLSLFFRAVY